MVNHFKVLELPFVVIQGRSESEIAERVNSAHRKLYARTVGGYANIPRTDGLTNAEYQNRLNQAKRILLDPEKRREHIAQLTPKTKQRSREREPAEVSDAGAGLIFRFANGDGAGTIPELATLMEKYPTDAVDALYSRDLGRALGRAGEQRFAQAARAIIKKYPVDYDIGVEVMARILHGKMKFRGRDEGETPQQLARLIDRNWEEAKTRLYNGSIALWLDFTGRRQLADTVTKVIEAYPGDDVKDIGLEMLVQELDPNIGHPIPKTSHLGIDFGRVEWETRKSATFSIGNDAGRGFLHGHISMEREMPGLRISPAIIRGGGDVAVTLDTSFLAAKRSHRTELVIAANGGRRLKMPISCYVDYSVQESIRRTVRVGLSMAAVAAGARWMLLAIDAPGWLVNAEFVFWNSYWVEWFEWPWLEWKVKVPGVSGFGYLMAFAVLSAGVYWFFFRKRRRR